ncbi:hypothetical protein ABZP36_008698 [Zizania latifolia]
MKKALHSMLAAILLLHLLLTVAFASLAITGSTGSLFHRNDDGAAARSSRRLLQQQPTAAAAAAAAAMATNTFHVKGVQQAPANAKPKVEFDASMRPSPRSNFNPRHN